MINSGFWRDKRVFLTGHTGFKGSWMALMLRRLGACVYGFALPPEDRSGVFVAAQVARDLTRHWECDVKEFATLRSTVLESEPEIVIHMAAQSLVRRSFSDPVTTYATNVLGTIHALEALRSAPSVKAAVIVTSDKCYGDQEAPNGYRETDRLGGDDPYSASKACAELVVHSYRQSLFSAPDAPGVASVRAGNVIGGGDWAIDRIVPDAMRAFINGEPLKIRNPMAVRPWQHVLDPAFAYLLIAERLCTAGKSCAEAWNFGPAPSSAVPVASMVDRLVQLWGAGANWQIDGSRHPAEAATLTLDCGKAIARLGWRPLFDLEESLQLTVEWYKALQRGADMRALTVAQIERALTDGIETRADLAAGLDG